jgi:arylsulfatase A-like enzyme
MIAAWAKNNAEQSHQQRLPIAAGAIQTQVASVCDLFPTIVNLLDLDLPANCAVDGASLDTLFSGGIDRTRNQKFLMHYPHAPHRSDYFTVYLDDRWKVIYHYFPSPASENSHYQLYNLAQDPFEQKNLATSKPVKLRRMMTDLVAALESHQAVYPVQDSKAQKPVVP